MEGNNKRQELIEQTKETVEDLEAKQNEALEQIRRGGDIERYDTVSLGELELEVKAWLPGETTDTVQRAMRMAESGDADQISESMEIMLSALDDMTVEDAYNMDFWRAYYSEYGPEGMVLAAETILGPAASELEEKREVVDGFRGDVERSEPSPGNGGYSPDA